MNNIDRALESLKKIDIYSMLLMTLFELKGDIKYSTLSELCYLVDSKSFFNLMEYYAGKTVTFPSMKEFKNIVDALCLYELVNIDMLDYNKALKDLNIEKGNMEDVSKAYQKICEVISKYNFKRD